MSSWGNNDNAANTPYWATAAVNLRPDSANSALLYNDTTFEDFKVATAGGGYRHADQTIGLFLVDSAEEQVQETETNHPVHSGWNLKSTGSGGRAGRVQWETLVALANPVSDNNSDDAVLPDAIITLTQPIAVGGPVSAASANTVTFSVAGTTVLPSTATLTYQWQVNNGTGGSWVNIDPGTGVSTGQPSNMIKTGATTATLILDPTDITANNYVFRAVVTATNPGITNSSATAYSANAKIVITA